MGMARRLRELWPALAVSIVAPAIVIVLQVAPQSPPGYPVRLELPPARPAEPLAEPLAAPPPELEFDLAGGPDEGGGSAVDLRKVVRIDGVDAGSATVRVSAGSTLSIRAAELRALLERAGQDTIAAQIGAGAGEFVEFDELRRLGIEVRYDAVADRVAIAL